MYFPTAKSTAVLLAATVGVSACSSASSTGPIVGTAPTLYEEITYRDGSSAVVSTLGGTVAAGPNLVGTNSLRTLTGTLDHATGATALTDLSFTLTDPDGPDGFDIVSDGTSDYGKPTYAVQTGGGAISDAQMFTVANYSYVRPIVGSHPIGSGGLGGTVNLQGVYGIVTVAADIPTAGNANYTGESGGNYFDGSTDFTLVGSSNISVDFVAGTVNLVADGLNMRGQLTGVPVFIPNFDEVRVTGMAISGNQFAGGTIGFYKSGTHVLTTTLFGVSPAEIAGGNFFGYDASINAPDEVGGVLSIEKTTVPSFPSMNLIFIAD